MSNLQTLSSHKLPRGFSNVEFRLGNRVRLYITSESRISQLTRLHETGKPFNIFALGFGLSAKVTVSYLQPFSLDNRFCGYVDLTLMSPMVSH